MRRFNILMLSSALTLLGGQALAGDLVINPFPVAPKSQNEVPQKVPAKTPAAPVPAPLAPMPPQGELYSAAPPPPVATRVQIPQNDEPLSVSASEFMELDPDLVDKPLGRPLKSPSQKPPQAEGASAQESSPAELHPLEALEVEPAAAQAPTSLSQGAPPGATPASSLPQKRPGLVYIRDGQILDDPSTSPPAGNPAGVWQAQAGQDMRQTLERWSVQAGVEFVWDCPKNFSLTGALSIDGVYEVAVQAALDQYKESASRPVAQLHENPQTYARVLVVRLFDGQ